MVALWAILDERGRVRTARRLNDRSGVSLRMRRKWFVNGDEDADTDADEGEEQDGDDADLSSDDSEDEDDEPLDKKKTYTAEEMEAILKKRLKRERETRTKKVLQQLGTDSIEDAKKKIADQKKKEDAEKSDLDKARDALAKAEADKKAAEDIAEKERAERINDRVNAKIKDMSAGVEHPDDVVRYIRENHAEALAESVDKNGKVSEEKVKKLIDLVQKARPGWFKPKGPGSPSNKGSHGSSSDKTPVRTKTRL